MKKTEVQATYAKIAFDIAVKIASGEIREGERFTGRSLVGSQYAVSPETIRRAMGLLNTTGIIRTQVNAGYVVESQQKAVEYAEQYQTRTDIQSLKARLEELLTRREALDGEIRRATEQLVDLTGRFQHSDWLHNYEFTIPERAGIVGKTIGELCFRQKTGATIIAMKRGETLLLSPGPTEPIQRGDILVVICEYRHLEAVRLLLEESQEAAEGIPAHTDC